MHTHTHTPPTTTHSGRGDAQFAPPTEEEAKHLRETEDLFKSNLLRCESVYIMHKYIYIRVCV